MKIKSIKEIVYYTVAIGISILTLFFSSVVFGLVMKRKVCVRMQDGNTEPQSVLMLYLLSSMIKTKDLELGIMLFGH